MADHPKLSAGEHARIAWNVARMAKRSIAGENVHQRDLERKVERVIEGARKRAEKDAERKK
jgi:hypothetical protein